MTAANSLLFAPSIGGTSKLVALRATEFSVAGATSFDHCRGQGYDGAQNFQGHVSGVAKRFENDDQAAISVHSLSCTLCKPVPPGYSKG